MGRLLLENKQQIKDSQPTHYLHSDIN